VQDLPLTISVSAYYQKRQAENQKVERSRIAVFSRMIDRQTIRACFNVSFKYRIAICGLFAILLTSGAIYFYVTHMPVSAIEFQSRLDQVTRVRVAYYDNQAITVVHKKSIRDLVGIFAKVRERQSEPPVADAMALNFIFEGPGFQYWCYLRQDGYLFIRRPKSVLYLSIGHDLNRWLQDHDMFTYP
jgi:hypothetical protein